MQLSRIKSYNIQVLRGIAIIAVAFIHNTPEGIAQVWCRAFLNFSVGMFLFLSGMLSDVKNYNPGRRIAKVVVPYIIWTFIYTVMNSYKIVDNIPLLFVKNLLTGKSAAIMYYIFVYCELTILMPLIDKLAKSKYKYLGFLITPIEIIFVRLIPLIMGWEFSTHINTIIGISCVGWFIYYYIGYILGNNIVQIKIKTSTCFYLLCISIMLQFAEGFWYLSMGVVNCGTQLKLSSILSGIFYVILAFRFIQLEKGVELKFLYLLGNYSFAIYFSHLAIMKILEKIPYYTEYIKYPLNAIFVVIVSCIFAIFFKKLMGSKVRFVGI